MSDPQRVREVFEELAPLEPAVRERRLDELALDADTRREVLVLLGHHDRSRDFLGSPPASLGEDPDVEAGPPIDVIDRFRLKREIGRGGMGVVYLAEDDETGQLVALKVLHFGLGLTGSARSRFELEARTMERLQHPAIVPVLRSGTDHGAHFIASEYIEGSTLDRELDPERRTGLGPDTRDPRAVAAFLVPVARALAHAHEQQVLHRDVKPANVLIDLEGRPHLTDFGLARDLEVDGPTRSGDVAGTFAYMSPEQARGERHAVDQRTDVFALGVVLYEMLIGERPFSGMSAVQLARELEENEAPSVRRLRGDVPRPLQVICHKALEKRREDRYPTMAALADDLEAFAEGRPIQARPPSAVTRVRRGAVRRRRTLLTAAALIVVSIAGIVGGRALREGTATPVRLVSDPPGATVHVRPFDPATGEFGASQPVGVTPANVRVEPGLVRFVFEDGEGGLAELSREIPSREELEAEDRQRVEIAGTLVDSSAALAGMVRIPAGVSLHRIPDPRPKTYNPLLHVEVPAFAIDRHEVTVAEYRRFLEATGRPAPDFWGEGLPDSLDAYPAAGMSWADARDYAEWAGKRLPTLMESFYAAGGPERLLRPWGSQAGSVDSFSVWAVVGRREELGYTAAGRSIEAFARGSAPVGSHPRDVSPFGVADVFGSVVELIDRPWRALEGPQAIPSIDLGQRMAVGSCWSFEAAEHSSVFQMLPVPQTLDNYLSVGFRCARSLDSHALITMTEVEEAPPDEGTVAAESASGP